MLKQIVFDTLPLYVFNLLIATALVCGLSATDNIGYNLVYYVGRLTGAYCTYVGFIYVYAKLLFKTMCR